MIKLNDRPPAKTMAYRSGPRLWEPADRAAIAKEWASGARSVLSPLRRRRPIVQTEAQAQAQRTALPPSAIF